MQKATTPPGFKLLDRCFINLFLNQARCPITLVHLHEIGHCRQASIGCFKLRTAGEQTLGVGVLWGGKNLHHIAIFDQFSSEHDRHVVGNLGDHPKVVRDEDY